MSVYASEREVRSTKIQAMHRWWLANCHGDIPVRADLDPLAFKAILPYMLLADVEHDPFRILYRLVGTKVVEATGFDFTGRYLDEMIPVEADEPWMDDYLLAYQQRRPIFGTSTVLTNLGGRYTYEFVLLPLRKNGAAIEQFVAVEDYFDYAFIQGDLTPWAMIEQDRAAWREP